MQISLVNLTPIKKGEEKINRLILNIPINEETLLSNKVNNKLLIIKILISNLPLNKEFLIIINPLLYTLKELIFLLT